MRLTLRTLLAWLDGWWTARPSPVKRTLRRTARRRDPVAGWIPRFPIEEPAGILGLQAVIWAMWVLPKAAAALNRRLTVELR